MFAYWFMLSVLAFVTLFGVGMTVNMLMRRWWVSLLLYALFSVYLWIHAGPHMIAAEWVLYGVSCTGVMLSAWASRVLRARGYALFL
ncbi:MAG: hypothetical protein K6T26_04785 [Alicyclobacillus sp.]|nr:hypothetical protein [Alicyclobacillus sp.]